MRGHLLRAYKITTEHSPWCFCRIWGNQGMNSALPCSHILFCVAVLSQIHPQVSLICRWESMKTLFY